MLQNFFLREPICFYCFSLVKEIGKPIITDSINSDLGIPVLDYVDENDLNLSIIKE
jgi:hypothetical protein